MFRRAELEKKVKILLWGSAWAEWQQEAGGESLECRAQVMLAEQEQVFKERSLRSGMVQDMVHGPQSQGMMFLKPRVKGRGTQA